MQRFTIPGYKATRKEATKEYETSDNTINTIF